MSLIQIQSIESFQTLVYYKNNKFRYRLPIVAYTKTLEALVVFGKSLDSLFGMTAHEYYCLEEEKKTIFHSLLDLLVGKYFVCVCSGNIVTYIQSLIPLRFPIELLDTEIEIQEEEFEIVYETDSSLNSDNDITIPSTPTKKDVQHDIEQDSVDESLMDALIQFQLSQR
jgi:hypothetical protein